MNTFITPKDQLSDENILMENIIEQEEYYLIKDNSAFKFIIGKLTNEIIIKCKNYEIRLNYNDLSILTKAILKSIDEAYEFIINIFEYNKAFIKDIKINKTIKLLLKVYILNIEKDIEILLLYNKKNKDIIINKSNKEIENDLKNLKNEIKILKEEIEKLKMNNNLNINNNEKNKIDKTILINNNNIENEKFYSNPENIKFLSDLSDDSFSYWDLDNLFTVFKSINGILYLIYSNKNNSIIIYNLINNKNVNEIKEAHNSYITNIRHYLDNINKKDLIISSSDDNNIKLWNFNNFDCILSIKNVNKSKYLFSVCILNINSQNYILTSNWDSTNKDIESIKVFDFIGNKIKEINNSNDITNFIDSYLDIQSSKNFIITGNKGYVKSYDYNKNKIYYKYYDNDDNEDHYSVIIYNIKDKINLIESSTKGIIRIWNFNSGELLNKIKINNEKNESFYGICLWNYEYLFVGSNDKTIKLIKIKEGKIIKNFNEHIGTVKTIKKIKHPKYGECLISLGEDGKIKLWANN